MKSLTEKNYKLKSSSIRVQKVMVKFYLSFEQKPGQFLVSA